MHRVLLLDSDDARRAQLTAAIARTAGVETVVAADEEELLANVQSGGYAAVFADEELLPNGTARLITALRGAVVRPMFIIASNRKITDLDPDMVTLVMRKPYDVQTLTGILLAAVMPPPDGAEAGDSAIAG